MNQPLDAALAWFMAGCSVVPVATDGSKRPAIGWKPYQTARADPAQLHAWFGPDGPNFGIGVVCGAISGYLEMLELEGRALNEGLGDALDAAMADAGHTDLWDRLTGHGYAETSPSGGVHLYFRVGDGEARHNTKLARRPATDSELAADPADKIKVLIETRGAGGYTVVAPTGGHCHPTGRPWIALAGTPADIPTITAEQRDTIYAIANLLDGMPAVHGDIEEKTIPAKATRALTAVGGLRPGDDFNAKTSWEDLLIPAGWTRMWRLGNGWGWRRPGKNDRTISATTGTAADGVDRLYVFSTSVDLPTETPLTKFAYHALTEHGGDYAAAARALGKAGFGSPPAHVPPPVGPKARHLAAVPDLPAEPGPQAAGGTDGTAALAQTVFGPPYSDAASARALIGLHGGAIKFCPDRGRWLHWDGARWKWQPRGGGSVRELAKDVADHLPRSEAGTAWAKHVLSANGTTAVLTQAETDPRITVALAELDADPWALNTPGGIVDLRTGELRPCDPAALHTRCTLVTPDFHADASRWHAFLRTTFGGDEELIGYLQRLVGYSATGYVGPHILPFAHGMGGNGKGAFLESAQKVLGDYATTAPNAFLMAQTYSQHETEIARLAGARMVLCSEVNEKDKFDEAKVKRLTGGDTLTARFMRQDHFTFAPTHHLWLLGNSRPAVTSGGRSFWRRCRLIPFLHEVPDSELIDDLQGIFAREDGAAILAWIVRGAAQFAAGGLREPESVTRATAEYAHDQDTVARFVEDACHRGPVAGGVRCKTSDMVSAYERWCAEAGEQPVTSKRLGMELRQRFDITVERSHGRKFYAGIMLLSQREDDEESSTRDEKSVPRGQETWWQK